MLVEVSNIPVKLDAMLPGNEAMLSREVSRACGCRLAFWDADGGVAAGVGAAGGAGASVSACALSPNSFSIVKRSVDARKKSNVHFVVTVVANVDSISCLDLAKGVNAKEHVPPEPLCAPDLHAAGELPGFRRPIVVGAGPAGLFCAYYLAMAGLRPLVVERGKSVDERMRDVDAFAAGGTLDANSNVQFGEGGAGTFSDGKLNTGTKSPHIRHVLQAFVDAGAPRDILVDAKPHIGTDLLPGVICNLRKTIEDAGGSFSFSTLFCGACASAGGTDATGDSAGRSGAGGDGADGCGASGSGGPLLARLQDVRTGELREVETDALVLAIGHSARDTYEILRDEGIAMERKPFAVGVRIEHLQSDIDAAQYGPAAGHPALGAADYKLAVHNADGRGVYTFCMCPGGTVVAAASEPGRVCVNGMSSNARDGRNANSALLVGVAPEDLPGDDVLEGVRLQRDMESAAFDLGKAATGVPYSAPSQTVGSFMAGRAAAAGAAGAVGAAGVAAAAGDAADVPAAAGDAADTTSGSGNAATPPSGVRLAPSYPRGVGWVDLHDCLPEFVSDAMEEALPALGRKLRGFDDPNAVMTGVEARSSSPVKLVRDRETMQSTSIPGVYPAGEGAGYAGGIVSAAVDGLRVAEAVAQSYGAALRRASGELPKPRAEADRDREGGHGNRLNDREGGHSHNHGSLEGGHGHDLNPGGRKDAGDAS